MQTSPGNFETALRARQNGLVAIPCQAGTKVPAVKWKEWQAEMPPLELQRAWFADTRANVAIICTGMVLFDCETLEKAELVLKNCGDTPHRLRSPGGGVHLGYRKRKGVEVLNTVKIKGMDIDIRTDGGIEVIPNSETEKGRYEWLGSGLHRISELPVAKIGWTRERTRKVLKPVMPPLDLDVARLLYRGRKYVDTFPRSVSGEGGHRTTFIAALKITRFVGRDAALAWQLLLYYNATKCDPAWSERELRHKHAEGLKIAR